MDVDILDYNINLLESRTLYKEMGIYSNHEIIRFFLILNDNLKNY